MKFINGKKRRGLLAAAVLLALIMAAVAVPLAGESSADDTKTLAFDANGGTGAPATLYSTDSSVYDSTYGWLLPIDVPTRSGYTFEYWNTASDGSGLIFHASTAEKSSHAGSALSGTMYAIWSQDDAPTSYTYTLTYDANGGTGAPATQTVSRTTTVHEFTVSDTVPAYTGHTFKWWQYETATTTVSVGPGGHVDVSSTSPSITLTAVWNTESDLSWSSPAAVNALSGSSVSYTPAVNISDSTFTKVSGASWLAFSNGYLSGTAPSVSTTTPYTAILRATSPDGQTASQTVTVTVYPVAQISAGNTTVSGVVGTALTSVTLTCNLSAVYSVASGTLPAGLSLSSAGVLSGTPTAVSSVSVTVQAVTAEGPSQTATVVLNLTVAESSADDTKTLAFDANGGTGAPATLYSTDSSVYDSTYGWLLPTTIPTRSGYDFEYWNTASDGSGLIFYASTASTSHYAGAALSCTLYAIWSQSSSTDPSETVYTYTLEYDADGGTGAPATQTATSTNTLHTFTIPSTVPTRTGYDFSSWWTSDIDGGVGEYYSPGGTIGVPYGVPTITLKAMWTLHTCTVTFDANGGTGTMATQTFTAGTAQTLRANAFTYDGYSFLGWATAAGGTAVYTDCQELDLGSGGADTLTLYAVWEKVAAVSATVTFDLNGGANTGDADLTETVLTGNTVYLLADGITNDGYVLSGWTLGSTAGTAYAVDAAYTVTGDVTFYAVWTQVSSYLDGNAPASCDVGTGYTYSPDLASDSWVYWDVHLSDVAAGSCEIVKDECPSWLSCTASASSVTFSGTPAAVGVYTVALHLRALVGDSDLAGSYVVWYITVTDPDTMGTYTVSFAAGDGSGSHASCAGSLGTAVTLPSSGFSEDGYKLAAWSISIDGTTVYYPLGSVYTVTGTVTFTAYYAADTGVIVFDANGGTVDGSSTDYEAYAVQTDGAVTMPSSGLTRSGYTFAGWYLSSDSGSIYAPGYVYSISSTSSTIVMMAYWIKDGASACTVTYDANGGTGSLAQTVEVGKSAVMPTSGYAYDGHSLKSWNLSADGTGTSYALGGTMAVVSTAAVTVYAQWTGSPSSDSYTVTFLLNGGSGSIQTQTVSSGGYAAAPSDPSRSCYVFLHWQANGGTGEWDFAADAITSDTVLTAIWARLFTTATDGDTVTITMASGYSSMDTTIEWGDGSDVTTGTSSTYTHTYEDGTSGTLTVTVTYLKNASTPTSLVSSCGYSVSGGSDPDPVPTPEPTPWDWLEAHWYIALLVAVFVILLLAVVL